MSSEASTPTQPPTGPGLWTRALDGDREALETLAERYWYTAYVWLRVAGNDGTDTAIHIVSFFARLQNLDPPRADEPGASRFRDLLLARLKDYAAAGCPSTGGFPTFLLDVAHAERRFSKETLRAEDELFARRWSLTILEQTLSALKSEYDLQGKGAQFLALKPFLGFNRHSEAGYAEAANSIGMSTSAFHMTAFTFRSRYRELLRSVIADTVRTAEDVDSELTVLLVGAS
jgi:hypothetical protein